MASLGSASMRVGSGRGPRPSARPAVSSPVVDGVEEAAELEVGEAADVGQRAGEVRRAVGDRRQPADEAGAPIGQDVEIEVGAIGGAGDLRRGDVAGADQVVDLVVALVESTDAVEPPHDVVAPIGPRQPDVFAHGHGDVASGAEDLVGELHAGRRRADDEHPARPQLLGTLVLERVHLVDRVRQRRRHRRDPCSVERAAGHDHGRRLPGPGGGLDPIAVVIARQRDDLGVGVDRGAADSGVAFDLADQLSDGHEPVGIVAAVGVPGKARLPVGREQPQGVPPLGLPGVGDLAPFEHDVLDRSLGEHAADREAGVAGPDHHHGDPHAGGDQLTVTVTFVGLVITSNTADRFCDWATSASRSSWLASASIS